MKRQFCQNFFTTNSSIEISKCKQCSKTKVWKISFERNQNFLKLASFYLAQILNQPKSCEIQKSSFFLPTYFFSYNFNYWGSGGEAVTSSPLNRKVGFSRPTMSRARCLRARQYYPAQKNSQKKLFVVLKQGRNRG